jgi:hypothetical protein
MILQLVAVAVAAEACRGSAAARLRRFAGLLAEQPVSMPGDKVCDPLHWYFTLNVAHIVLICRQTKLSLGDIVRRSQLHGPHCFPSGQGTIRQSSIATQVTSALLTSLVLNDDGPAPHAVTKHIRSYPFWRRSCLRYQTSAPYRNIFLDR